MKNITKIVTVCLLVLNLKGWAQVADSSKRVVKVSGAINFRDAGGYKTKDGHQVKWGKVYRSAALNKLTDSDLDTLVNRHINTVIDFRSTSEMTQAKDHLPANVDYELCPQGSENLAQWMKIIPTLTSADSLMASFYGNIDSIEARNKVFFAKLILVPDTSAILFHCTAGKDRTGMAAALFLYALNVPMETIMDDYLASNIYRKNENEKMANSMVAFLHIKKQLADELAGVKPAYLEATFSAINKKYGSVDNFLAKAMGIGPKQLKLLRSKYTQ